MPLSVRRRGVLLSTFFLLSSSSVALSEQQPFASTSSSVENWWHASEQDFYSFSWPIHKVAIIGAGASGIMAYRELTEAGFDVHVFERDTVPGGNWHYTDETPVNAPIPNADVAVGDFVPSLPPEGAKLPYVEHYEGKVSEEILRQHRGPKPVWKSLVTNLPPALQQFRGHPWPEGQPWSLPQERVARYIRAIASYNGINSNDIENRRVSYNTRVELVERRFISTESGPARSGWTLTLKQVSRTSGTSSKAIWTKEDFDAVVIATGRYNAPYVPNIPGLKAWADQFPDRIVHSRQYRRPQAYTNKTVLLVGAGTSGVEIAVDLAPHARKIVQSMKDAQASKPLSRVMTRRLPANVTVIPEIKRFLPPMSAVSTGGIELTNGTIISGIESIIFSTGYRYSFPFLPQFHNSSANTNDGPKPIVTDGTHLRGLFLDILSIEEPTLGFMCMNTEIQCYGYSEYISVALSKVWGNRARIPSIPQLWIWYEQHVLEKGGYGKKLQYLGFAGLSGMIRLFTGWLNDAAIRYGGRQIDQEPASDPELMIIWFLARFGVDLRALPGAGNTTHLDQLFSANAILPDWDGTFSSRKMEKARIEIMIDGLLYGYDW